MKTACETIRKILFLILSTFGVRKGVGFKSRALIVQISPIFKDFLFLFTMIHTKASARRWTHN